MEELYSAETKPQSFRGQKGNLMVLAPQLPNDRSQRLLANIKEMVERYLPVKATLARATGSGEQKCPGCD